MVSSNPPILNIDTRPLNTVGTRQSYGATGGGQSAGGSSPLKSSNLETYRRDHLFDVSEEVDDDELEALLEEEGLYLGSFPYVALYP